MKINNFYKIFLVLNIILTTSYSQYSTFYINPNANHKDIKSVLIIADHPEYWTTQFFKCGFNIVDRSLLDIILKEKKMTLSGLTMDHDIKDLINADAVFYFNESSKTSDSSWCTIYKSKLVSIATGEILFVSEYSNIFDCLFDDSPGEWLYNNIKYKETLIPNYKSQISN